MGYNPTEGRLGVSLASDLSISILNLFQLLDVHEFPEGQNSRKTNFPKNARSGYTPWWNTVPCSTVYPRFKANIQQPKEII